MKIFLLKYEVGDVVILVRDAHAHSRSSVPAGTRGTVISTDGGVIIPRLLVQFGFEPVGGKPRTSFVGPSMLRPVDVIDRLADLA